MSKCAATLHGFNWHTASRREAVSVQHFFMVVELSVELTIFCSELTGWTLNSRASAELAGQGILLDELQQAIRRVGRLMNQADQRAKGAEEHANAVTAIGMVQDLPRRNKSSSMFSLRHKVNES